MVEEIKEEKNGTSNKQTNSDMVLSLMRFSKALSQNLRCDKVTINE